MTVMPHFPDATQIIFLRGNLITNIGHVGRLSSLTYLELDLNRITAILKTSLAGAVMLDKASFSYNNITSVVCYLFSVCVCVCVCVCVYIPRGYSRHA